MKESPVQLALSPYFSTASLPKPETLVLDSRSVNIYYKIATYYTTKISVFKKLKIFFGYRTVAMLILNKQSEVMEIK